jgi:NDP-sugar pyrophosphorylase family protein
MKPTRLSFDPFFSRDGLHAPQPFPEDVLDLLGGSLATWLEVLLTALGPSPTRSLPGVILQGQVYISEGVTIEPTAMIQGPTYIGPGSEIRHGAYIRGTTYIGKDCVVGHTTEVKGSCFLDGAKAGHFAYVGDCVLGREVNLGAGTKIANLRLKQDEVYYKDPSTGLRMPSGLRKFGAILGDHVQTGCNSVLSPGSLLLPHTGVFPCVHFHGTCTQGFIKN